MEKNNFKNILYQLLKLSALGVLMGVLGGFVGGCFSLLLAFVTDVRSSAPWVILLLPLGGIITVLLYRICRMSEHGGTNEIICSLSDKRPIKAATAPLIFISTAITHLFGGSAGREGAALQLGGSIAATLSDALRLKEKEKTVFIMSGMSAVFAGVFGTPLTAAFFVLEFRLSRKIILPAILPCFISAAIAQRVASLMGAAGETAHIKNIADFSFHTVIGIIALALSLCVLGRVMCFCFHKAGPFAKKLLKNPFLRSVIGALIVIALTAAVGDMRYNGSGMNMAIAAIEGNAQWFDFILKILFTFVTLAAGFKGGEIVPTFCIGATFGCVMGSILGLDSGFCAALGLVGLFCCATNSFVSAIFLGIEMFGFAMLPYLLIICIIICLLPNKNGLFKLRHCSSVFYVIKNKCKKI